MALTNEAEQSATALGELDAVALVTRGWPADGAALPCIAVILASETPAISLDSEEYTTELEYYLHIFTATASQGDALAAAAHGVMRTLGYDRTFANEQPEAAVAHLIRRYRRTA